MQAGVIDDHPHDRHGRGRLTGRVLTPAHSAPYGDAVIAWTGGANIGTPGGRLNVTMPLAVLTSAGHELTLRLRPRLLGRMGAKPLEWQTSEITATYPVRGRFVRFNRGVAIESAGVSLTYFWTWQPRELLSALQDRGATVDWHERYIALFARQIATFGGLPADGSKDTER